MPRTARQTSTSGIYHIMLRGIYRQGSEEVEQSMKRLEVSYAQYFNKKYGRTGHFFQDRNKSEPCEDFSYFLTLLRYIHQNPVKAGITRYTEDYPWSSWHEYLGTEQPYICDTNVPIKRLQQSGLTLRDLIEMVNELTPNREQCPNWFEHCRGAKEEDNSQPLPDDCGCLEPMEQREQKANSFALCRVVTEEDDSQMDETDIPQRLSDEQVRDLLEQICGCRDSAQFQRQSFDRQRDIVAEAATMGAAINQLARITGLSYRQVYKTVKKK